MRTLTSTPLVLAIVALAIAACGQPSDENAPETAATMAEGQNETTMAIEPGIGSPPEPGAGVPDASRPDAPPNPDGTNPVPPLPREATPGPVEGQ